MELREILEPECVLVPLKAKDKDDAIEQLIQLLDDQGKLDDVAKARQAVFERERIRSTGIGRGLAVPHGKCPAVKDVVLAAGKLDNPINFGSVDNEPVILVALLISPTDKTGPHIQALARVCNVVQNDALREKLWNAKSPQELYETLVNSQPG